MRRKKTAAAVWAAAVIVMVAGGCQKKYEAIDLRGAETEAGAPAARGTDAGGRLLNEEEGLPQETAAIQAETSMREQNVVGDTAPEFKAVDETVYVSGDSVNLRASASTGSSVMAVSKKGDKLRRTGYAKEWSRVEYEGMTCYIASRYVTDSAPQQPEGQSQEAGGQGASDQNGIGLDPSWKYAEFSKINGGSAKLYKAEGSSRKGITVCVNAGHGTSGGSGVKTLCHPDGTPKVTGGTTGAGATSAVAVSGGMTFSDGTAEAKVTLAMAKKLKEKLLAAGYDVLMIRESDDVQLDNIARTVIANNCADCHIALHWDSTTSNKGAFYMSVPNVSSYRNMEPVKSNWEKHNRLGESLVSGLRSAGVKIFSGGSMEMDLTQTSFSTIPSIDIELGDKASDHSDGTLDTLAAGLLAGVNQFFGAQ